LRLQPDEHHQIGGWQTMIPRDDQAELAESRHPRQSLGTRSDGSTPPRAAFAREDICAVAARATVHAANMPMILLMTARQLIDNVENFEMRVETSPFYLIDLASIFPFLHSGLHIHDLDVDFS
jgi:hypothetical protein